MTDLGGSAEPVAPPLLPCPFCGGAAHIESAVDDPGEWFVGCQGCNAILGPVFEDSPCADEDTPAPRVMLTNAWNRRALARAPQGDAPSEIADVTAGLAAVLDDWKLGEAPSEELARRIVALLRGGASSSGSSPLRERPLSPADLPLTFGMPKEPGDDMGGQST